MCSREFYRCPGFMGTIRQSRTAASANSHGISGIAFLQWLSGLRVSVMRLLCHAIGCSKRITYYVQSIKLNFRSQVPFSSTNPSSSLQLSLSSSIPWYAAELMNRSEIDVCRSTEIRTEPQNIIVIHCAYGRQELFDILFLWQLCKGS